MSDSMTNLEIEDVLSSIRRLVSDDAPKSTDAVPKADGRLILTPALRVPDDAETGPAAQSAQVEEPQTPEPDLDNEHGSDAEESEAPSAENPPERDPGNDSASPEAGSLGPEPPPAVSEPGEATLESRIAELEEAVGRTRQDWEPDGSEPGAGQMPKWHKYQVADSKDAADTDEADDAEAEAQAEDAEAQAEDESTVIQPNPVFFRAAVPQPEPYVLAVADHDPDDADASERESESANKDAQPAVARFAESEAEAEAEVEAEPDRREEDEFLDETALRSMVAEIVREELRGHTGEQITGNMRRMLRREIQRAIALRDVD